VDADGVGKANVRVEVRTKMKARLLVAAACLLLSGCDSVEARQSLVDCKSSRNGARLYACMKSKGFVLDPYALAPSWPVFCGLFRRHEDEDQAFCWVRDKAG
jgi:hypothetical protein